MTKKEINEVINRETQHIDHVRKQIEDLRFDIKASQKAIRFWKNQRKTAPEA